MHGHPSIKVNCQRCGKEFKIRASRPLRGAGKYCSLYCRTPSPLERFWAKIVKQKSGCWEWTGHDNGEGYGTISVGGKPKSTHRMSWEIHHGPIPKGLFVLHHCDNPPCVNPKHLFLGNHLDNAHDKEAKGRGNQPKGEKHHKAVLTEALVRKLRHAYTGKRGEIMALCRKYALPYPAVQFAVKKITWRHI